MPSKTTEEQPKIEDVVESTSNFLDVILKEISSRSAYTQIGLGTTAGWLDLPHR